MKTLLYMRSLILASFTTGLVGANISAAESTVWHEVKSNPQTTTFAQYARDLGLSDSLDTDNLIVPWTLFVPSDDAFAKLPQKIKNKIVNDEEFKRKIITSHMVLGASVSVDGIGSGNTLTTASGLELDLIQKDNLYIKDVIVVKKDLVGSNGVVHLVECVMYVQPSKDDDRLTAAQRSSFEQTACCLADSADDLHHQALLK
jgi:uncharacterized surface protein with fasciclin (FAS1) repeats